MNIFVLDSDPRKAARMVCDKHVVKMALETVQMLVSALIRRGVPPEDMPRTKAGSPYKETHKNHPCTRWAGDTEANFLWLWEHGMELCLEYSRRYYRVHRCYYAIYEMSYLLTQVPDDTKDWKEGPLTPHPQAMPDDCKRDDPVDAYRSYYNKDKREIAEWSHSETPEWFCTK